MNATTSTYLHETAMADALATLGLARPLCAYGPTYNRGVAESYAYLARTVDYMDSARCEATARRMAYQTAELNGLLEGGEARFVCNVQPASEELMKRWGLID